MDEEELPRPTGVPVSMDRVIHKLQERSASVVQNLTWDIATRDATIEALQERLDEEAQLRQEAEGALVSEAAELREAREQISKLVAGHDFLMGEIEQLRAGQAADGRKDAFLEAPTEHRLATENAETELVPVPAGDEQ
jgi:hypothetical protein